MGISRLKFHFWGDMGEISYHNAQGEKTIRFGFGHNVFQQLRQEGYSDLIATVPEPGHTYRCAASAAWTGPQKLHVKVQIIDKYFGILDMVFSFRDNLLSLTMVKTAEAFLDEYQGSANGKRV